MTPVMRSLTRLTGATLVIFTATFSLVKAGEMNNYSCCGNASDPTTERCRYTDRGVKCDYDSTCTTDTGYTICCTNGCFKYEEE